MKKSTTKPAQPKPDSAGPFFQPRPGLREKSWDTKHEPFFSPLIQPKLMVGAANSPAEAEADRMAGQVVQRLAQPEAVQREPLEEQEKEKVQRQPLEEEDKLQKKAATEEDEAVQTKPAGNSPAPASVAHSLQSSKGGGQPLSAAIRGGAEQALGADFGSVRVHTDAESARMNEALHAQAFTHGQDVYFNEGKYRPETTEGKRLLGHELGHVVQQEGNKYNNIQRSEAFKKENLAIESTRKIDKKDLDKQIWMLAGIQPHYGIAPKNRRALISDITSTGNVNADRILWLFESAGKEMRIRDQLQKYCGEKKSLRTTSTLRNTGEHSIYKKMDVVPSGTTTWDELAAAAIHAGFWVHAEDIILGGKYYPPSAHATGPHLDLYLLA